MSIEVGSIDFNDQCLERSSCSLSENDRDFHEKIFTQSIDSKPFIRNITLLSPAKNEQKTQQVAYGEVISPMALYWTKNKFISHNLLVLNTQNTKVVA